MIIKILTLLLIGCAVKEASGVIFLSTELTPAESQVGSNFLKNPFMTREAFDELMCQFKPDPNKIIDRVYHLVQGFDSLSNKVNLLQLTMLPDTHQSDHIKIIQLLLDNYGANVNATSDPEVGSSLILAAWYDDLPLVKLLLEYGATPLLPLKKIDFLLLRISMNIHSNGTKKAPYSLANIHRLLSRK